MMNLKDIRQWATFITLILFTIVLITFGSFEFINGLGNHQFNISMWLLAAICVLANLLNSREQKISLELPALKETKTDKPDEKI